MVGAVLLLPLLAVATTDQHPHYLMIAELVLAFAVPVTELWSCPLLLFLLAATVVDLAVLLLLPFATAVAALLVVAVAGEHHHQHQVAAMEEVMLAPQKQVADLKILKQHFRFYSASSQVHAHVYYAGLFFPYQQTYFYAVSVSFAEHHPHYSKTTEQLLAVVALAALPVAASDL